MQPKYKLSDVSKEEQEAFMSDFQELLNKHSLYFEPIPQLQRLSVKDKWEVTSSIFLQKKTEIMEVEVPKATEDAPAEPEIRDAEIVSPLSEEMSGNA